MVMKEAYTVLDVKSTIDRWHKIAAKYCESNEPFFDDYVLMSQNDRDLLVANLLTVVIHCGGENSAIKSEVGLLTEDLSDIVKLAYSNRNEVFTKYDSLVVYFLEFFKDALINTRLKSLVETADHIINNCPIQKRNTPALCEVIFKLSAGSNFMILTAQDIENESRMVI